MKARKDKFVSASELAQMAYCERQVAFDAARGQQPSRERQQAQQRGQHAHRAFFRESQRIAEVSQTKGRCFVATLVFGESEQTRALRAFRDLWLRRSVAGRWVVGCYYRVSPSVCSWMDGKPRALAGARMLLRLAAWAAGRAVQRKLGKP